MAKLFASDMVESVCSNAIQVHGGHGYASDIQRLVIGRCLAQ